ncbi:MAG: hypothetical protein ACI915_002864 [Gammaproteobacteria bacterium]
MNDGQWHHIVATFSTATGVQSIYVDGNLEASQASGSTTIVNMADLIIGGFSSSGLVPMNAYSGLIDDVQIYDETLSATQVNQLFANPGSPVPLPPALIMILPALALLGRRREHLRG